MVSLFEYTICGGQCTPNRGVIPFQTDDKGVFSTSLSKEYSIVADTFGLNKKDLWNLSYRSIDYIFASESVKDILRKKWNMMKNELLLGLSGDT